jgi:hypothetical protein
MCSTLRGFHSRGGRERCWESTFHPPDKGPKAQRGSVCVQSAPLLKAECVLQVPSMYRALFSSNHPVTPWNCTAAALGGHCFGHSHRCPRGSACEWEVKVWIWLEFLLLPLLNSPSQSSSIKRQKSRKNQNKANTLGIDNTSFRRREESGSSLGREYWEVFHRHHWEFGPWSPLGGSPPMSASTNKWHPGLSVYKVLLMGEGNGWAWEGLKRGPGWEGHQGGWEGWCLGNFPCPRRQSSWAGRQVILCQQFPSWQGMPVLGEDCRPEEAAWYQSQEAWGAGRTGIISY